MVPRVGNETLRPLGFGAMLRTQASDEEADDVFTGRPYIVVAPVVTSWAVAGQRMVFFHMFLQARVTLEAFPIVAPRGRSVSFPTRGTMVTYVTWDVPLHGNFELRPLGATMGNVIPTPPCWGECKPNSRRRRAQVNSTIWLRELPLFGRLMLSVTLSSFGQRPELHT